MSNSLFKYDCENYSFIDLIKFVESQGFKVDQEALEGGTPVFLVSEYDLYIHLPDLRRFDDPKLRQSYRAPIVSWQKANEKTLAMWKAKQQGDEKKAKQLEEEINEKHVIGRKLYQQLKRKFQLEEGEIPDSIKDLDKVKEILNQKKSWWPFGKV